ncbi:Retrovirus-related Pol polyprotein from transposon TNT 1-94 [Sesamum angolense]|uniref:Retrovirus-related Pol polyprotein from transposon TNT 1-94 n=1 Tax=Sesamum angolense TaxID=2727404 RepID=A0AAE2C509_9LAMI|nr:Retrovirus-related Pol polyprotein from transposon TNT 1-94 [Sesamum angolense]
MPANLFIKDGVEGAKGLELEFLVCLGLAGFVSGLAVDWNWKRHSEKLGPRSEKFFFVGYPKQTKGYYFYNQSENKVFVAWDGVFLESQLLFEKLNGRNIHLEEVQDDQPQNTFEVIASPVGAQNVTSTSVKHITYAVEPIHMDEPTTYKATMASVDFEKWLIAMKSEMEFMKQYSYVRVCKGLAGKIFLYEGLGRDTLHFRYPEKQIPITPNELERMSKIPYASAIGSIMYAMVCTRPDVSCALSVVSWKSSKQNTMADSTIEAEYIVAAEAAKDAIWVKNFIFELGVVPSGFCSKPRNMFRLDNDDGSSYLISKWDTLTKDLRIHNLWEAIRRPNYD